MNGAATLNEGEYWIIDGLAESSTVTVLSCIESVSQFALLDLASFFHDEVTRCRLGYAGQMESNVEPKSRVRAN